MESLTEADEMAEFMFLGLRMTEGVSMEAFAEYFGKNMENVYGEVLKKHLEIGMLEQKGDRIYLSRKGNPCEQWSDGGFSAVEKFVDFLTLTNECSWQYTDKKSEVLQRNKRGRFCC